MHLAHGRGLALLVPPLTICVLVAPAAASTATYSVEAQEHFIEGKAFDHICDGWDEEWGNCEGLPDCGPCTPSDCIWGQWGEWEYAGGCIGLDTRERKIEVRANQCGKPCDGAKEETKPHVLDRCKAHGADCIMSPWTEWTPDEASCASDPKAQATRTREVEKQPETGGTPCTGALKETRPCGGPKRTDCRFGPWQEWTSCSATCGEGRHTRMRRVEQEAHNDGDPCVNATLETAVCSIEACPGRDCELSTWTEWSPCDLGRTQTFRRREMITSPMGSGAPCEENLMETFGCPTPDPVDCIMSQWGEWSQCDKNCDGGQRYKERKVKAAAKNGGTCEGVPLKATEACNTIPCQRSAPQDCVLTQWGTWSACSANCGTGSRERTRKVLSYATWGGSGCAGGLLEVGECTGEPCGTQDCVWEQWETWSGCSATCGGGSMHRARKVAQAPANGGKPCEPLDKGQVAPCNTQPCGEGCIDAVWGQWSAWTECSGTCHIAYKSRSRHVEVPANFCGRAPLGFREEFAQCTELPSCTTKQDCQLSEWEEWSQCSEECFGIRERNRFIVEFASGGGLPCDHGLKQIEPCHPGESERTPVHCSDQPVENCVMDDWSVWSSCSQPCGGGQMARRRSVLVPAKNGGRPCHSDLLVTAPCNTQACLTSGGCQDCEWGPWTEWSACSQCGGQKYRHRSIEKMPNRCGKRCDLTVSKEVTECPHLCGNMKYCAWTEWAGSVCGNRCGSATASRTRQLSLVTNVPEKSFLFISVGGSQCSGTQVNQSFCPDMGPCKPCTPIDCTFGAWTEWSAPTCQGLCERSRVVAGMNNECGQTCEGALLETKKCPSEACQKPVDCELSQWSAWTPCQSALGGQRYRNRQVLQKPRHGGNPCQGVLSQTIGCGVDIKAEACRFGPWSAWSPCSLTCGIGWHIRSREIISPPHGGGIPCHGNIKELQHCEAWDDTVCHRNGKVDCVLGDWGSWSVCGGDGQQYRDRQILQPASHDGEPCEGSVHETRTCEHAKVDCRYSDWTEWDQCDQPCGKGQSHRHRQIHRFPENGGESCPHELMMTKGCELAPCVIRNATVSSWSEWGQCQAPCGPAIQLRTRTIVNERDPGGKGFTGTLGEAQECPNNPECEMADCAWNDWAPWGACSHTCGGGQRKRERHIKTYPQKGGKKCESADMGEVEPCSTQPCTEVRCEDGKWFDWTAWSPCSASCDGGTTFRTRKIAKMANECGCPPAGKDRESAFCNVDKPCGAIADCKFSPWSAWQDCSASCDGVMRRSRHVEAYGAGGGEFCKGPLRQTYPCNPVEGEDPPDGCLDGPPRDCVLSEWGEWSLCSATCGGGEHIRSRSIVQHPANRGKPCEASLSEIKECARSQCGGPAATDCKFGHWEEWGECDKCSGERTRFRSILAFPVNGGKECEPTSTSEVGSCPRRCHHPKYCEWEEWSKWTACTVTCGKGGKRRRRRHLFLSEFAKSKMDVLTAYATLEEQAQALESGHSSEATVAFVAGCVAVLVALGGVRFVSTLSGWSHHGRAYAPLPGPGQPAHGAGRPDARQLQGLQALDDPELE